MPLFIFGSYFTVKCHFESSSRRFMTKVSSCLANFFYRREQLYAYCVANTDAFNVSQITLKAFYIKLIIRSSSYAYKYNEMKRNKKNVYFATFYTRFVIYGSGIYCFTENMIGTVFFCFHTNL